MNWNMLGHEWAVDLLRQHVAQGDFRHAYLFTGPRGVGRRTLALRLAQAINCLQPTKPGEPCLTCRACQQIERMQHPDLALVQAEQEGGTLRVEQVRELQHSLSLAPYEARYRIALLLRFEEANPSASNALLKTLEEPPDSVVMLLTAQSAESLLPTVVSRCEVLRLRPLPLEAVAQGLQARWGLPADKARELAHLSGGRPGKALQFFQAQHELEERQGWLEDHQRLLASGRVERFKYAEKLAKDKTRLRAALEAWLSIWRDVFLRAAGASIPITNLEYETQVDDLASRVGMHTAFEMLSELQRTTDMLDSNVNARLATEVFLLDLPRLR